MKDQLDDYNEEELRAKLKKLQTKRQLLDFMLGLMQKGKLDFFIDNFAPFLHELNRDRFFHEFNNRYKDRYNLNPVITAAHRYRVTFVKEYVKIKRNGILNSSNTTEFLTFDDIPYSFLELRAKGIKINDCINRDIISMRKKKKLKID